MCDWELLYLFHYRFSCVVCCCYGYRCVLVFKVRNEIIVLRSPTILIFYLNMKPMHYRRYYCLVSWICMCWSSIFLSTYFCWFRWYYCGIVFIIYLWFWFNSLSFVLYQYDVSLLHLWRAKSYCFFERSVYTRFCKCFSCPRFVMLFVGLFCSWFPWYFILFILLVLFSQIYIILICCFSRRYVLFVAAGFRFLYCFDTF